MASAKKTKNPSQHKKRRENPDAKCPRHTKKDYRLLVQSAWSAGWWCEKRRKYIYCFSPNGEDIVKVPMTPSSARTLANVRGNFAAAGLAV